MVEEAKTLRLYPEQNIAANIGGFSLFQEIRQLRVKRSQKLGLKPQKWPLNKLRPMTFFKTFA
ncbi:hypothetical protein PMG11_00212 [Penicillium brasilianum]|uniref:Uncharacterized protein n=1 Tax=Penicillium brasilianum TaxID=104259 RepID=A0A0F7TFW3_PENBI|nr:hypothetical protein PMG11_00212 [Penicillium brasilianum]